jgi:phage-Barnase-EndoU-ColicinE5/D-RelE like nuclease3
MWDHPGHQVYDFGSISLAEALRIKRLIAIDIAGYRRVFATRGARHVKNNHTDPAREAQQLQFPVRPADFELIPEIVAKGEVRLIGRAGSRKPARLEHRATIEDRVYIYLETIGTNDRCLELWTMRIEHKDKGTG